MNTSAASVTLFNPCVVQYFLPQVADATLRVLSAAGFQVHVERRHTCCGQAFYNAGEFRSARRLARRFVRLFAQAPAVVTPSFSCARFVTGRYPDLLLSTPEAGLAARLVARVFEVHEFLLRHGVSLPGAGTGERGRAILHWSCHAPDPEVWAVQFKQLAESVSGLRVDNVGTGECCGFGGVFMLVQRPLAEAMGVRRLSRHLAERPDVVVLTEPGCLLHMRTCAHRAGIEPSRIVHLAQVLAEGLG